MGFFFVVVSFNQSFFFCSLSLAFAFACSVLACMGCFPPHSLFSVLCVLILPKKRKNRQISPFLHVSRLPALPVCSPRTKSELFAAEQCPSPWTRSPAQPLALHPSLAPFSPAAAFVVNTERTLLYIPSQWIFIFVVLRLLLGPSFFCSNFTFLAASTDFGSVSIEFMHVLTQFLHANQRLFIINHLPFSLTALRYQRGDGGPPGETSDREQIQVRIVWKAFSEPEQRVEAHKGTFWRTSVRMVSYSTPSHGPEARFHGRLSSVQLYLQQGVHATCEFAAPQFGAQWWVELHGPRRNRIWAAFFKQVWSLTSVPAAKRHFLSMPTWWSIKCCILVSALDLNSKQLFSFSRLPSSCCRWKAFQVQKLW